MEAYKSGLEEIENHIAGHIAGLQEEEKKWMKNWQLSVHATLHLIIIIQYKPGPSLGNIK